MKFLLVSIFFVVTLADPFLKLQQRVKVQRAYQKYFQLIDKTDTPTELSKHALTSLKSQLKAGVCLDASESVPHGSFLTEKEVALYADLLNFDYRLKHGTPVYQKLKEDGKLSSLLSRIRENKTITASLSGLDDFVYFSIGSTKHEVSGFLTLKFKNIDVLVFNPTKSVLKNACLSEHGNPFLLKEGFRVHFNEAIMEINHVQTAPLLVIQDSWKTKRMVSFIRNNMTVSFESFYASDFAYEGDIFKFIALKAISDLRCIGGSFRKVLLNQRNTTMIEEYVDKLMQIYDFEIKKPFELSLDNLESSYSINVTAMSIEPFGSETLDYSVLTGKADFDTIRNFSTDAAKVKKLSDYFYNDKLAFATAISLQIKQYGKTRSLDPIKFYLNLKKCDVLTSESFSICLPVMFLRSLAHDHLVCDNLITSTKNGCDLIDIFHDNGWPLAETLFTSGLVGEYNETLAQCLLKYNETYHFYNLARIGKQAAIHSAAEIGHVKFFEILLEHASSIDFDTKISYVIAPNFKVGDTALLIAMRNKQKDLVKLLLKSGHVDLNAVNSIGESVGSLANRWEDNEIFSALAELNYDLNSPDEDPESVDCDRIMWDLIVRTDKGKIAVPPPTYRRGGFLNKKTIFFEKNKEAISNLILIVIGVSLRPDTFDFKYFQHTFRANDPDSCPCVISFDVIVNKTFEIVSQAGSGEWRHIDNSLLNESEIFDSYSKTFIRFAIGELSESQTIELLGELDENRQEVINAVIRGELHGRLDEARCGIPLDYNLNDGILQVNTFLSEMFEHSPLFNPELFKSLIRYATVSPYFLQTLLLKSNSDDFLIKAYEFLKNNSYIEKINDLIESGFKQRKPIKFLTLLLGEVSPDDILFFSVMNIKCQIEDFPYLKFALGTAKSRIYYLDIKMYMEKCTKSNPSGEFIEYLENENFFEEEYVQIWIKSLHDESDSRFNIFSKYLKTNREL